ncbi:MAG: hydroxysqualene dehydroxylase HpnE, partial [Sideroxydans sp.]
MDQSSSIQVGIIGGGYAGMAAAAELTSRGVKVTVFESAKQLGGRARGISTSYPVLRRDSSSAPSIQLSPEGGKSNRPLMGDYLTLDNGQHLLLGCYRETLRLIELVGGDIEKDFLCLPLQLDLHGQFSLKAPCLPAPLHLLVALINAQGLTWTERMKAAEFMLKLQRANFQLRKLPLPPGEGWGEGTLDTTVTQLLRCNGQDADLSLKLWEPLCIAALNTPIHKASAQVLLNVLRDALNRKRADSDMLLPRIDFTALFPQPAADYVELHGGTVHLSCAVECINPKQEGFDLVTAEGTQAFSHVICATPPSVAAKLLRPIPEMSKTVSQIDALEQQPIYTVYLQYPAHVRLPHPMIGLHQRFSQWLFDKGQIAEQYGLLAAVISAEGIHQELSQDELAEKVIAELRDEFGIVARPDWLKVIAEKRATFC